MMVLLFFIGGFLTSFFVCLVERRSAGENWWSDRSRCNLCHVVLSPWELVPVFSYILLGGTSRCCNKKIPRRYLFLELIGAITLVILGYKFEFSAELIYYAIASMGLYYLSIEDLHSKSLYTLDYFIVLILILISAFILEMPIHLLSGLFLFVILFLIHKIFPQGLGEGDPWIGFILGILCHSIWTAYLGFTLAFVIGAMIGIYLRLSGDRDTHEIPFIPCLALSGYILMLTF